MIRKHEKRRFSRAVWVAASALAAITIVGLINLTNAASYTGETFHQTQVLWVVVGLVMATAVAFIDLRFFEQLAPVFFWIAVALLAATLLFGREVNHSRRWILGIQPSEFVKVAMVLMMARFFHTERNPERYTLRMLLKPMAFIIIPMILILMQPDLGTSLVVMAVGFSIMFFEGIRFRSFLALLTIGVLIVPLAWNLNLIKPYQKDRVRVWLEMTTEEPTGQRNLDKGMQPEQALWAVGSGRFAGKGGGQGIQSRLRYLPEMHNDYIFASYAEERGFIGCVLLIGLYTVLVVSLMVVAIRARERFGVLVSIGAVAIIFWQVFFNIGMVLGIFPVVGLTLPLMSYGGSSILSTMLAVGLALNAGIHRGQV
ncbi:MAG TPA: rod shape-determining protein RodA [Myxococcota bacterium]|nr:rod shape-determining protein RodA [Myxococcota bacterium]HOD06895.1 rod shape-determining protein RodA [Myxococcota bacterium]HPB50171.1 rod shape-determining protein RodA [Myxococcota bacterium]HQP95047.1 rod shape-determining protein RodA [Myxococcota bacterium]